MDTKPAQQPEVIKPTAPSPDSGQASSPDSLQNSVQAGQAPPKPVTPDTSMPSVKNSGTGTPPPPAAPPSTTPPTTAPPPSPNKPDSPFKKLGSLPKNIKIAIGLGVGLLVIMFLTVIGGVIVNATKPVIVPTPTPPFVNKPTSIPDATSTWRTYSSEKYGFEIKYPHEFTLSKTLEDKRFEYSDGVDIKNFNRVTRFTNPNSTWMQIETLYTKDEIADLSNWLKTDFPTKNSSGTSSGALRNILPSQAAGQEIVIFEDGVNETRKNVVFYKDRRMIIITLFPTAETGGSYTDIKASGDYLNQMLATFKYTDISFVPINQNVIFDDLGSWRVIEETRDRIYIANSNKTKVIKFFKKTNVSGNDIDKDIRSKMVSNIGSNSGSVGGQYTGGVSGCQKTGTACNRLVAFVMNRNNATYVIMYENNNSDPEFQTILDSITIK